ncbi:MAG: WD40/YVTN/BNR-like repeat-containing protein, partial [Flavobacteriaceae bacterium]
MFKQCKNKLLLIALIFTCNLTYGQELQRINFEDIKYRNVGPTRGGRSTSVCGVIKNEFTFYMGTSGGGLWKTIDGGLSWNNISDGYFESPSIGSIDVFQSNPDIIYVGTGSDGIRSNVIVGKGAYKSLDAGKSWEFIGLKSAGQIGAIKVHPENPDIVYAAAIGQPFKQNTERGLFKSIDGGKNWEKILYISDKIGIVDMEFSPDDPNTIYAASWEVNRKPWTIMSGSKDGGIYKSVDGGQTWTKLSKGLPKGNIGKIDLATSPADTKRLYALIEAGEGQGGVYVSYDKGSNFKAMSHRKELVNRPFYYCNIYAHPKNADVIYSSANKFMISMDAGKTWEIRVTPHGDNHDIWINPNHDNIWIQSNDGGGNVTFNSGKTWTTQFNQPTAEIYQVEVDQQFPYWLYGGQQDNYTTVSVPSQPPYPIQAGPNAWILSTGGCETGPAVPKPSDPNIVYSNCKGRFSIYNKETGQEKQYYVGAQNMYGHNPKDLKFRFQRVSPIHISPHDENVIYHGSQFLHKTTNGG